MNGTIQNRDSFLKNIASRLGKDQARQTLERPVWKYQPQDKVFPNATSDELVDILKKQCENIHTTFVETTKDQLQESMSEVIHQYGGESIVKWKDERFDEYGLTSLFHKELVDQGIEVHEWDYTQKEKNIELANVANIGITISDITLAESGTAVLFSSKDHGRTVSFLPLHSIIIVPKSSIVKRMTQAARIIRERTLNGEHLASCINFITGPSNSADIEMNLVVGVHGPVKATYVMVEDL